MHQLCKLRFPNRQYMKVTLKPCPAQNNGVDCGVFAIANALELCLGRLPEQMSFNIQYMRPHLLQCLKTQQITPFPKVSTPGKLVGLNAVLYYPIYCSCRDTFFYSDALNDGELVMIKCCRCGKRFHKKCANVEIGVFLDQSLFKNWNCGDCSQ